MEVYTVTLQFKVKVESKGHAMRMAELCEFDYPIRDLSGFQEVVFNNVRRYETIPDEEE